MTVYDRTSFFKAKQCSIVFIFYICFICSFVYEQQFRISIWTCRDNLCETQKWAYQMGCCIYERLSIKTWTRDKVRSYQWIKDNNYNLLSPLDSYCSSPLDWVFMDSHRCSLTFILITASTISSNSHDSWDFSYSANFQHSKAKGTRMAHNKVHSRLVGFSWRKGHGTEQGVIQ